MDSLIVDVAIGLVFVFGVLAAITSALTEFIASRLGLRARYLLQGIRSLLDGNEKEGFVTDAALLSAPDPSTTPATGSASPGNAPDATRILSNALVANQGQRRVQPLNLQNPARETLRKMPSYLPGRTFARGVVAALVPNASGATTLTEIEKAIGKMNDGVLRKSLLSLVANAENEVSRFGNLVEEWYDDHMARVSGWYKRHVGIISRFIGLVLVLLLNVNAISLARSLYANEALREGIVSQAASAGACGEEVTPADCLKELREQLQKGTALGLPIGWSPDPVCEVTDPCSWAERYGFADPNTDAGYADERLFLLSVVGLILTALALAPGSRFWFDLLGRLGTFRSTGPKPGTSAT